MEKVEKFYGKNGSLEIGIKINRGIEDVENGVEFDLGVVMLSLTENPYGDNAHLAHLPIRNFSGDEFYLNYDAENKIILLIRAFNGFLPEIEASLITNNIDFQYNVSISENSLECYLITEYTEPTLMFEDSFENKNFKGLLLFSEENGSEKNTIIGIKIIEKESTFDFEPNVEEFEFFLSPKASPLYFVSRTQKFIFEYPDKEA